MRFLHTITLRQAVLLDAIITGIGGVLVALGAGFLADWLGIAAAELRLMGLVLVPYAAYAALVGTRSVINRKAVWSLIVINTIWAVDSIVVLLAGWITPTGLGIGYVLLQALIVFGFAVLQYAGLRQPLSKTA